MKPVFKSAGKPRRRRVSLYLPPGLVFELQGRAKAEDRSFNNYCVNVLSQAEALTR